MTMTATSSTSVNPALRRLGLLAGLMLVQGVIAANFILLPIRVSFPLEDKLWHVAAFALPVWWFLLLYRSRFERRAIVWVFAVLALLGEALQGLTPYHTVEWGDAAANLAGVGLALAQASMRVLRHNSGSRM